MREITYWFQLCAVLTRPHQVSPDPETRCSTSLTRINILVSAVERADDEVSCSH